jgi:hypothetical protein
MNVQAPTTTLHHRPSQSVLAVLAALVVAGGTAGVLAITANDSTTVQPSSTSITKVAPDRVWDGSPILRGTASAGPYPYLHAIAPKSLRTSVSAGPARVFDGSPILRGHAAAAAVAHPSSVQGTLRSRNGRPRGFGFVP